MYEFKRDSNWKGVGKTRLAGFPVAEILKPMGFREERSDDVRFPLDTPKQSPALGGALKFQF
jgi:hypothetical protein